MELNTAEQLFNEEYARTIITRVLDTFSEQNDVYRILSSDDNANKKIESLSEYLTPSNSSETSFLMEILAGGKSVLIHNDSSVIKKYSPLPENKEPNYCLARQSDNMSMPLAQQMNCSPELFADFVNFLNNTVKSEAEKRFDKTKNKIEPSAKKEKDSCCVTM